MSDDDGEIELGRIGDFALCDVRHLHVLGGRTFFIRNGSSLSRHNIVGLIYDDGDQSRLEIEKAVSAMTTLRLLKQFMPPSMAILWTCDERLVVVLTQWEKAGELTLFRENTAGGPLFGWQPRLPTGEQDWRPADAVPEDYYAI